MLNNILKKMIEDAVELALEEMTLEEFLEQFDISPIEAVECLFSNGLIDQELMERIYGFSGDC